MSLQARLAVWYLKSGFKRKLAAASTALEMREVMNGARPLPLNADGVWFKKGREGGVPGEWAEGEQPGRTLLYLHGGGYVACSSRSHRAITVTFARAGFRVFAPDYRMAPEHVFPAAVDDALAVYRALKAADRRPIFLGGDSAGGGLALALMVALRDAGDPLPGAAVLFSPWTDLAATGESLKRNDARCAMFRGHGIAKCAGFYLGGADARNPLASPLYADLKGLPPMLIHVGEDEVLLDDSTRLAEKARAAGVPVGLKIWPSVPHAWQLAQMVMPEGRRSLAEAAGFLEAAS